MILCATNLASAGTAQLMLAEANRSQTSGLTWYLETSPTAPLAKSLSPDSSCDKAAHLSIAWQRCPEIKSVQTNSAMAPKAFELLLICTALVFFVL